VHTAVSGLLGWDRALLIILITCSPTLKFPKHQKYITKRPTTNGSIHFIGDTGNIAVSYATTPIPQRVYMLIEPSSKPYWHRILINKIGHRSDFYNNAYVIGYTK
jgi:hypothetical protein